jgi:glutathione S-transferase
VTDLILHHYDASPFTQRALRMLGIKRLEWRSVTTPMMPPKDDLVALTGGYRGTPVLQIGADVYVDSQRIARELERHHRRPTLFPDGNDGLAYAAVKWADAFFRAGLHVAIGTSSTAWPAEFREDRRGVFPDIDFEHVDVDHARAQLRVHAGFVEQQLADGRAFLTGDAPGLVDIHAWTVPWFTRALPGVAEVYAACPRLADWEARVCAVVPTDAQPLRAHMRVEVCPDDTRRGATQGELVSLDWNEVGVLRRDPRCGEVIVHFPRLGYRVTPLD